MRALDRILHSSDIKKKIEEEVREASSNVTLISAFVKLEALKFINELIPLSVENKTLMVRFRLEDIISGVTDLEIFDFCKSNNWRLLINLELHSKIFIFDDRRIIIGSANLTSSGIGLGNKQNIETIVTVDATEDERKKIDNLIEASSELDHEMFSKMNEQIALLNLPKLQTPEYTWNTEIQDRFTTSVDFLWTTDLFFSHSPKELCAHDIVVLGLVEPFNLEDVRYQFIRSKPYRWLKKAVGNEVYYGELSVRLHGSLLDDPTPYRRNVKILLSDLLNWLQELEINEIEVDRPNHSQRIKVNP